MFLFMQILLLIFWGLKNKLTQLTLIQVLNKLKILIQIQGYSTLYLIYNNSVNPSLYLWWVNKKNNSLTSSKWSWYFITKVHMALPFKMYTFNQLTQFNEISNNVEKRIG